MSIEVTGCYKTGITQFGRVRIAYQFAAYVSYESQAVRFDQGAVMYASQQQAISNSAIVILIKSSLFGAF